MAELFVVILGLKGFVDVDVDVDVELFVVIMNFIYIAYSVFPPMKLLLHLIAILA